MKNIFFYDEITEREFRMPEIILRGNERAEIEGVKEILCLSEDCVNLSLGKICLSVCGDCLCVGALCDGRITLTGNILSISFSS